MIPKEKAKELIYKFWDLGLDSFEQKECALITVDYLINTEFQTVNKLLEIIKQNKIKLILSLNQDYWQEVKKEIELM